MQIMIYKVIIVSLSIKEFIVEVLFKPLQKGH